MDASHFFTKQQQQQIVAAIRSAENETSGEIRVHVDNTCKEDVLDRAAWVFGKLNMHRTARRNGVLIYMAVASRKFAIIGDAGINAVTPNNFWNVIQENMSAQFAKGQFAEGLVAAIGQAGKALKEHFPSQADDINEQPDEISFMNND
jgi:uncharacterized membrane protein